MRQVVLEAPERIVVREAAKPAPWPDASLVCSEAFRNRPVLRLGVEAAGNGDASVWASRVARDLPFVHECIDPSQDTLHPRVG